MRPSVASRVAFLAAAAWPFLRRISTAFSISFWLSTKSPSWEAASTRAARQSLKPALVSSRSSFTSLAGISMTGFEVLILFFSSILFLEIAFTGSYKNGPVGRASRHRGNGGFRGFDEGFRALDKVTFLLLVLLVGAGVHIVRSGLDGCLIGGHLLVGNLGLLVERAALSDRVSDLGGEQADGAQRVIIAWDDPVHHVGIAVRVHHRDDRDTHAAGFLHGDLFGVGVNDEHRVRQLGHVLDAFEVLLQMFHLTVKTRALFLGQLRHAAVFGHGLEELQALDRFLERRPGGQCAAEPAVIHEKRAAALGLFGDGFLGLTLGTDKQNRPTLPGNVTDKAGSFTEHFQSLLQVDDVNAVALPEDVFLHLGIPTARLVTEVNAGLQQLLHGDFDSHISS